MYNTGKVTCLETTDALLDTTNLPKSVNWVEAGAVTPVKNQLRCGSCWAFSTTGALEGAHQIKSGTLVSLSEQQLVDCSRKNNGCDGGLMDFAFQYSEKHPIEAENDYPYKGIRQDCEYNESKGVVEATSFTDVPKNDPEQMKAAIALGPVSVGIQADSQVFQHYSGGVITSADCGDQIDHGVLAVGYGNEGGIDYILVKNSWGPDWGDQGYVKIGLRDGPGVCGINQQASRPTTD